MRIHILGGPGSGKSYGAKKISKILKLKLTKLDDIYYSNKTEEQSKKALNQKIKQKSWITEGHWLAWNKSVFEKADTIIYLDVNKKKRDLNLVKRWIERITGREEGRKPGLKGFIEMIRINHDWDETKARSIVNKYNNKTLTFTKADTAIMHYSNL